MVRHKLKFFTLSFKYIQCIVCQVYPNEVKKNVLLQNLILMDATGMELNRLPVGKKLLER